MLIKQLHRTG